MHIRSAETGDVATVYQFICELESVQFDREMFEKAYAQNLADTRNIYLVAEDRGKVIAFLSCHGQLLLHHLDMVFEIQEFYVNEAYRSSGVGKALLDVLTAELKVRNASDLEVTSSKRRTRAHKFYLNNGFADSHKKFTRKL